MKTNVELAQYCADAYTNHTNFDTYQDGKSDKDICYGVKHTPDEAIIAFRGTFSVMDWIRDLNTIADPFVHSTFGPVHPGFILGMDALVDTIYQQVAPWQAITIIGHSLGAARAAILVGLLLERGVDPKRMKRVVFGEPKPGFQQFANYISPVPGWSYRNGDTHFYDLVTALPFSFPPEEYVHTTPLIEVCEAPSNDIIVQLAGFSWHPILLYVSAVKKQQ
jgi:predicted lipase